MEVVDHVRHSRWKMAGLYVLIAFCAVSFGVLFHADMTHGFIVIGSVCLACVCVGISLVMLIIDRWLRRTHNDPWRRFLTVVKRATVVVVACVVSVMVGIPAQAKLIHEAQTWWEQRIPAIEAYKLAHGTYPKHVEDVADAGELPWAVSTFDPMLFSWDDAYCIDLSTGFTSGYAYSSESRRWGRYD